jgi:uncharacterized membrane protein YfcA
MWQIGVPLALANIAGSYVGARTALRHGAAYVRWLFIAVVTVLLLKTTRDAFMG